MPPLQPNWPLPLAGILVELGVVTLVTALLLTLRREARRYPYFRLWTRGWIAFAIAIALVALRHDLVPGLLSEAALRGEGPEVRALHAPYQAAKLLFLAFILLGAAAYARGAAPPARTVGAVGGLALGYGLLTGALAPDLNAAVAWQALVAVPAFAGAAWWLRRAPAERRGHGVRVLEAVLLAHAVLWTVYLVGVTGLLPGQAVLAFVTGSNSYLDAVLAFVLGLGTTVTVVEDTHVDTDRQRRVQLEQVERSEQQLQEILRAAHDGILTLDAERRITALNPAGEQIFRVAAADALGRPFDPFVQPEHRERLWHDLAAVTRRSEANPPVALRREVPGRRADGSPFPAELSITSSGERGAGYVIIARDLGDIVEERAERERLQQQLAQAARLETVGRMVSGVAHELNNPLTAILAFAQDLLAGARSPEDREALVVIVQQAQRCRVVVGDLLIFARNRREERRRVAPAEVVERVLRAFARDEARHGVRLETRLAPNLPPVEVDVVGIEQVLTNLLTNAFQATPAGGAVTLTVGVEGDRLVLAVEDTGPGIAPETLPRIFEPFFTTKEPGQGTGLGLAVSHAIVRHHGGVLTAGARGDGRPGAAFAVRLPFVDRRAVVRGSDPEPGLPVPALPGRRVLVVDDEASIRVAMRRALERRGWEVDEAGDGLEAMLRLDLGGRPGAYDAVVTDLRMPGLSGIELCDRLGRLHPELARRLVVITGDTASPAVAEFLAGGGRPFLQKPFDMRDLAELLDRVASAAGPA
jgi:PAS domain S-box-containing protein